MLRGVTFDLMLASYIVNPADNNDEIPAIAKRNGIEAIRYNEEVYGKGAKLHVPEFTELADHIARKTAAVFVLRDHFMEELKKNEQYDLFTQLELPLATILAKMEHTGVQMDIERLKAI